MNNILNRNTIGKCRKLKSREIPVTAAASFAGSKIPKTIFLETEHLLRAYRKIIGYHIEWFKKVTFWLAIPILS